MLSEVTFQIKMESFLKLWAFIINSPKASIGGLPRMGRSPGVVLVPGVGASLRGVGVLDLSPGVEDLSFCRCASGKGGARETQRVR